MISFSHSFRIGLLATNFPSVFLHVWLSWFPLLSWRIFLVNAGFWVAVPYFSFPKVERYCELSLVRNLLFFSNWFSLLHMYSFFSGCFQEFLFFFRFMGWIIMTLGMVFLGLSYLLIFLNLLVYGKIWEVFSHYYLSTFSTLLFPFCSFKTWINEHSNNCYSPTDSWVCIHFVFYCSILLFTNSCLCPLYLFV